MSAFYGVRVAPDDTCATISRATDLGIAGDPLLKEAYPSVIYVKFFIAPGGPAE